MPRVSAGAAGITRQQGAEGACRGAGGSRGRGSRGREGACRGEQGACIGCLPRISAADAGGSMWTRYRCRKKAHMNTTTMSDQITVRFCCMGHRGTARHSTVRGLMGLVRRILMAALALPSSVCVSARACDKSKRPGPLQATASQMGHEAGPAVLPVAHRDDLLRGHVDDLLHHDRGSVYFVSRRHVLQRLRGRRWRCIEQGELLVVRHSSNAVPPVVGTLLTVEGAPSVPFLRFCLTSCFDRYACRSSLLNSSLPRPNVVF